MSDEALLRARGFDGAAHVALDEQRTGPQPLSFAQRAPAAHPPTRHGSHVAHAKVGDASGLNWVRLS